MFFFSFNFSYFHGIIELQLKVLRVDGCHNPLFFYKRREVIIMETFLEFLKKVLKGIVRAISAYVFQKFLFKNKKTTQRRQKQEGGSRKKINCDNHRLYGYGCKEKRKRASLLLSISILT